MNGQKITLRFISRGWAQNPNNEIMAKLKSKYVDFGTMSFADFLKAK